MSLKLEFIASTHIDVKCEKCLTYFGLKEGEVIKCPFCGDEE